MEGYEEQQGSGGQQQVIVKTEKKAIVLVLWEAVNIRQWRNLLTTLSKI